MLNLVVLCSGNGSNLQAIIDAIARGTIAARIVSVLVNNPGAYATERAAQAGIPCTIIDHRHYSQRADFDQAITQHLKQVQPDLIVLAGFMRVFGAGFTDLWQGKLINIHPSLLPKHKGLNTHGNAIAAHETMHGATVHMVNAEVDTGTLLAQAQLYINSDDTAESLQARVLVLEHQLLPWVLQLIASGELVLASNHAIYQRRRLTEPLLLPLKPKKTQA